VAKRNPYSAALKLVSPSDVPSWMNEDDAARHAAYSLYEDIYWSEPGTFKLQQRGTNDNPLYVPSGRIITNTMNRYLARNWRPVVDPDFGTDSEKALLTLALTNLSKRERLQAKFRQNKLWGTMRGDWCWHITANPNRPEGSRISVKPIDPRLVFLITAPNDVDRVIGVDLAEQEAVGDETFVRRTRYLKPEHPEHPSTGNLLAPVSFQVDHLEVENWDSTDPEEPPKIVQTLTPPTLLPPTITSIPVYHIKNNAEPQNPYGLSEMRGIERLMGGINQTITDEELTLALHGLGMYKSSKGQPQRNGVPVPWDLGPGKVVHDETFDRVTGVTTIGPFLEHNKYLEDRMSKINGVSDVAQGDVDVTTAESGIALAIRLGPIIEESNNRDEEIMSVMDNMLFDLRFWMAEYEGVNVGEARAVSKTGSKIPENAAKQFDALYKMVSHDPPLITMAYFRDAVRELGYDIPPDVDGAAIAAEMAEFAEAVDPDGARLAAEGEEGTEEFETE